MRTLTQKLGYSKSGKVVSYSPEQLVLGLESLHLGTSHMIDEHNQRTAMSQVLVDYFEHRAHVLNTLVEPKLMDLLRARDTFELLLKQQPYKRQAPMNKQKGEKRTPAYFTGIINMIIETHLGDLECDFDPRQLTTITLGGMPLRTLARRVDGAFPSVVSPVAIWEIKEYYFTTSFGSRVSGGVYETLLDGLELEELREHESIDIKHYLMIDGHLTWWEMGKPFLCRIVDMLHMGYVDEVLFGHEVVEELPRVVKEWVELASKRPAL